MPESKHIRLVFLLTFIALAFTFHAHEVEVGSHYTGLLLQM